MKVHSQLITISDEVYLDEENSPFTGQVYFTDGENLKVLEIHSVFGGKLVGIERPTTEAWYTTRFFAQFEGAADFPIDESDIPPVGRYFSFIRGRLTSESLTDEFANIDKLHEYYPNGATSGLSGCEEPEISFYESGRAREFCFPRDFSIRFEESGKVEDIYIASSEGLKLIERFPLQCGSTLELGGMGVKDAFLASMIGFESVSHLLLLGTQLSTLDHIRTFQNLRHLELHGNMLITKEMADEFAEHRPDCTVEFT